MTAPRVLVTLCTYNERENLQPLVEEIHRFLPTADVLVIDDNSPDGTGQLADELAERDQRVHVLHREGKLGLGSATLAGFRYAIQHGYDWLINMDADFSHHPRYLPSLMEKTDEADVVIGSRYVPGGGVEGWGWKRHFMSRGINWYARWLLGLPTRDNSGAYRCYRVAKLRELDLERIRSRGYSFQEEILYRCRCVGCRFVEVPIVFEDRRFGSSKINWRESVVALWILFRLALDRLLGRPVSRTPESTS
ncbi:MAG: polyprenol monophosphomannose synthase [Planctomycetes bacterium]|nr:polyprenol monophosphomannose synthase [Planctomycetota bacterium]